MNLLRGTKFFVKNFWLGLRESFGDRAYERYVEAQKSELARASMLSRQQFYVEQLNRRYSRPSRCC
jgi:uncharacterized short protein YbdD (DUF466 family)